MKHFTIRFNDENYSVLKQISDDNNIPIGQILNFLVEKYLLDSDNDLNVPKFVENKDKNTKTIKISITDSEYQILKKRQKIHLHSSMAQEAKYYIFNAIYNDKVLSQLEVNALALARAEIHKIGVNLNQLARAVNNKEIKEIPESFKKDIEIMHHKIDDLKNKINAVIEKRNIIMS